MDFMHDFAGGELKSHRGEFIAGKYMDAHTHSRWRQTKNSPCEFAPGICIGVYSLTASSTKMIFNLPIPWFNSIPIIPSLSDCFITLQNHVQNLEITTKQQIPVKRHLLNKITKF